MTGIFPITTQQHITSLMLTLASNDSQIDFFF